jgi:hypothetical protein
MPKSFSANNYQWNREMINKFSALSQLRSLLISSALALLSLPALAETILSVGGPAPDTVDNVEVADGAALNKAGATKLSVFFDARSEDNSDTDVAWLLGSTAGKINWKVRLPLKLQVNRAKTDVICRKGQIVVMSQSPGSAAYTSQTIHWDGKTAALVGTKRGDPSQDIVNALIRLGEKGTRAQLADWHDQEHTVMYPGNYITQANLETILDRGHRAAMALEKAGKQAMAAERMEVCFDASQYLVELENGTSDETKAPAKWIAAWSADCMQLPATKWTPMLKDYAQLLQKCGKQKQATNVHTVLARESAKSEQSIQVSGQASGNAKTTNQR